MLRKLAVAADTEGHSVRVSNERSISEDENMCPLW